VSSRFRMPESRASSSDGRGAKRHRARPVVLTLGTLLVAALAYGLFQGGASAGSGHLASCASVQHGTVSYGGYGGQGGYGGYGGYGGHGGYGGYGGYQGCPPVPLSVHITSGPPSTTTDVTATFTWDSTPPGYPGPYECSVDGQVVANPCKSPYTTSQLALGQHKFTVDVPVKGGNGPSDSYGWTIVAPSQVTGQPGGGGSSSSGGNPPSNPPPDHTPPVIRIHGQTIFSLRALLKHGILIPITCNEPCTIQLQLLLAHGLAHHLGLAAHHPVVIGKAHGHLKGAGTLKLRLKVSHKAARHLRHLLHRHGVLRATVQANGTDNAGNKSSRHKRIKLKH
jgi:hypothetical protein